MLSPLAHIRRAGQDHLDAADGKLAEDNAEDFLVSAHDALTTLADELGAQLRLGVAEEINVYWDEERNDWRAAVYLQSGRRKRCRLSEYHEMPVDVTEDDLRRAVIEVAFVHDVTVEPFDVEVSFEYASWGNWWKYSGRGNLSSRGPT